MMSACWSPGSMMLGLSAADCGHAGDGGNSLEARRIRVGGSRVFFLDGVTFRAQPQGQNEAAARLSDLLCFTIRCRHRQGDDRCQHDMLYAHPNLRASCRRNWHQRTIEDDARFLIQIKEIAPDPSKLAILDGYFPSWAK